MTLLVAKTLRNTVTLERSYDEKAYRRNSTFRILHKGIPSPVFRNGFRQADKVAQTAQRRFCKGV